MTGIEKIVAKIREDADADYRRVVDEAKEQADAIVSEAAEAAQANSAQIIADAKSEAAEIERRAVSMAGLEVRKLRLQKKQEIVQKAFDQALGELTSLPEDEYRALLIRLASAAAQDGAQLIFSAKDRAQYGAAVAAGVNENLKAKGAAVTVADETRQIPGGVIVRNGRVEINCAFDTLLGDQREELAADIAKILF